MRGWDVVVRGNEKSLDARACGNASVGKIDVGTRDAPTLQFHVHGNRPRWTPSLPMNHPALRDPLSVHSKRFMSSHTFPSQRHRLTRTPRANMVEDPLLGAKCRIEDETEFGPGSACCLAPHRIERCNGMMPSISYTRIRLFIRDISSVHSLPP